VILRLLRKVPPDADNDFTLSTADQIIATFDSLSARIGLVSVSLAAVSLLIGAIGIANVMFISVTERTREIGLRLAVGARRRQVLVQFLLEAAFLAGIGGVAGVLSALAAGALLTLVISGFSAVPPLWAVAAGLITSVTVGVAAGYWPAQRAAALAPVEALRYE
jgi:putative ABC transport system permease protein